jgi:transcriptional regulator with XRE-family HTH domain
MGLRELARKAGVDHAMLSRCETGHRTPSVEYLTKVLDALGVEDPEREELLEMVRRTGPGEVIPGVPASGRQLAQLIGYERAAVRITQVAPLLVPGILQTREYAQALLSEEPAVKRLVRLRMERTEILTRDEGPVELHAIVHEEALTRQIAPPDVMAEQMQHLLRMAERPNVTIQVVPSGAATWMPSLLGPFIVLGFEDAPPVVHLEHYRSGVFLWEDGDVRSYLAAASRMTDKAMTPARSAEVLAQLERESR